MKTGERHDVNMDHAAGVLVRLDNTDRDITLFHKKEIGHIDMSF